MSILCNLLKKALLGQLRPYEYTKQPYWLMDKENCYIG